MAAGVSSYRPVTPGKRFLVWRPYGCKSECTHGFLSSEAASFHSTPCGSATLTLEEMLSIKEAEVILGEKVRVSYQKLYETLKSYDTKRNFHVSKNILHRILNNFAFPLTDVQFQGIVAKLPENLDGTINYPLFLDKYYNKKDSGVCVNNQTISTRFRSSYHLPAGASFEQIQKMVKEKIQQNSKSVKKALHFFDYNRDGVIQKSGFRKVLESFCFRMTDQQFAKLWKRYNRHHHTDFLDYYDFLQQVDDDLNKQSSHLDESLQSCKMVHTDEENNLSKIEDEFRRKLQINYTYLKKAFQFADTEKEGLVFPEDFKSVLRSFVLPLTDRQFSKLMKRLGVKVESSTEKIAWEEFLEKLSKPVAVAADVSASLPENTTRKCLPLRVVPSTVDAEHTHDLLRKRVRSAFPSTRHAFLYLDKDIKGWVTRRDFQNMMDQFQIRIEPNFKQLMIQLDPQNTNKISYEKFFNMFGTKASLQNPDEHKCSNSNSEATLQVSANSSISLETKDGKTLKEKVIKNWIKIQNEIGLIDKTGKHVIHPLTLKAVLDTYAPAISEHHFKCLLSRCHEHCEDRVNYLEFFDKLLQDTKPEVVQEVIGDSKQNKVQKHLDQPAKMNAVSKNVISLHQMSPAQVIFYITHKFLDYKDRLQDLFDLCDVTRCGRIMKKDFRKLILNSGILMTNAQFKHFTAQLHFQNDFITSKDFKDGFSEMFKICHSTNEMLNSAERNELDRKYHPPILKACNVEALLQKLISENSQDVMDVFDKFCENQKGFLVKENFKSILTFYAILPLDEEFEELCNKLGISEIEEFTYKVFLEKLSSDGTINRHDTQDECLISLPNSSESHELHNSPDLIVKEVAEQLRCKLKENYAKIYAAFRSYDFKRIGFVSPPAVKRILEDLHYKLDSDKFYDLLHRFGFGSATNKINYEVFLRNIENNCYVVPRPNIQEFTTLSPSEAGEKLESRIKDQIEVLQKAFSVFDKQQTGWIPANKFLQVLDAFCFKLTLPQWNGLKIKCGITSENSINYKQFLDQFLPDDQKQLPPSTAIRMEEDIQDQLQDLVLSNKDNLLSAFQEADYADLNVVSPQDFRNILGKFDFSMQDDEFEKLLPTLPVNEFGNVTYRDFLKQYIATNQNLVLLETLNADVNDEPESKLPALESVSARPQSAILPDKPHLQSSTISHSASAAPYPSMANVMVNAESVEKKFKKIIYSHWKAIQQKCRRYDLKNTGLIGAQQFKVILSQYGRTLSDLEFSKFMQKYDLKGDGYIQYVELLRHFVLTLKPKECRLMRRQKLHKPMLSVIEKLATGTISNKIYDAMLRLRDTILDKWKLIRRAFANIDKDLKGNVSLIDFRKVLKQFNVNLTEDEFFEIISFYDKDMTGQINYNMFLRAYIKSW